MAPVTNVTRGASRQGRSGRPRRRLRQLAVLGLLVTVTVLWGIPSAARGGPSTVGVAPVGAAGMSGLGPDSPSTPSNGSPGLTLSISAIPSAVCVNESVACGAGVGRARVTLTAQAPNYTSSLWPPVQVAFVIETTPYDGVYDPTGGGVQPDYGLDKCGAARPGSSTLCEESNGVPFFVSHAQAIANAIAKANPNTNVSFAMVDYFATLDELDDGDGQEYHVDIPRFVPPAQFGYDVAQSFQAIQLRGGGANPPSGYVYGDSDLSDNILHSSSITALYGTIIGSGLNWSAQTHHVIVWIGSTAPRDTEYPVDYQVSPADPNTGAPGTCEPSFRFGDAKSPTCEGWVTSHDGKASDSIAELARLAPTCTNSIAKVCTIDTVDLYATPTDPRSPGWPNSSVMRSLGGGPGGAAVVDNAQSILDAGCALAAATGGTWSGPSYFACPNGTVGTLGLETVGSNANQPNTDNPELMAALQRIGFGPEANPLVANGSGRPMFQFVPYGSMHLVPNQQFEGDCSRAHPLSRWSCDPVPVVEDWPGVSTYSWNWSDAPATNQMYIGDVWSVSFLVYAGAGPFGLVPVDACQTYRCHSAAETLLDGQYTWATYRAANNHSAVVTSFPLEVLTVMAVGAPGAPPSPSPGPPPNLPATGVPVAGPLATGVPSASVIGSGAIALQALSVGLVAAGFIRITVKVRTVAMPMAMRSGRRRRTVSLFDAGSIQREAPIGRFD